jgi:hypothetical protein
MTSSTLRECGGHTTKRVFKLAPGAKIYSGAGVAVFVAGSNAGYAAPAGNTADASKTVGLALGDPKKYYQTADNTGGQAGAVCVEVELPGVGGRCGPWKNSATNALTQAHVGRVVFWEDDETLSHNTSNKRQAGLLVDVDAQGGLWLDLSQTANTATA